MAKQKPQADLGKLPACAAEFTKLVIRKMRYRKKVRTDVMAELADHFREALKNCRTNEEKEEKAQRLIKEFGDAKVLGILLRRAKKRCRPLWRTVVARTFRTAEILVLLLICYVIWFLTGTPTITTNYVAELNRLARPGADERQNAWPLYQKAIELYDERWDDVAELRSGMHDELTPEQKKMVTNDMRSLLPKPYDEVSADEKQRIYAWISNNQEIIDLVVRGAQRPHCWREYRTTDRGNDMMYLVMPGLGRVRCLVRILCWQALLSAEQGRYGDACTAIKSSYRFGRHVRAGTTLIEQLVGISIEADAVQRLRHLLADHEIDAANLAVLQADIEGSAGSEDFAVRLDTERILSYDAIQRSFTDGFGGGHIIPKQLIRWLPEVRIIGADLPTTVPESSRAVKLLGEETYLAAHIAYQSVYEPVRKTAYILFLHPDKRETTKTVDRLYDYFNEMARKTPAQLRAEGINVNQEAKEIIEGNVLLEILVPAVSRVFEMGHRLRTDVEATIIVLAILRYRQDEGDYPETLQELRAAGYLHEIPIDPYSDKPLVYKRTDEGPLLYSVWEDFKDNGGRPNWFWRGKVKAYTEGDMLYWPPTQCESPHPRVKTGGIEDG